MSALSVLLELVPLGALAFLVCAVTVARLKPVRASDWNQASDDEPEWWPEFERDFALYVATIPPGRDGAPTLTRLRRPPARD
jgi:hypothetical protein